MVVVNVRVSLPAELLARFDEFWRKAGYGSRSEAVRAAIMKVMGGKYI